MTHLLIITAHADDMEFFCGGTVCHAVRRGCTADLIIVTDSARGSAEDNIDLSVLAQNRLQEARAAAEILGLREVICLDYSDGFLRDIPINTLRKQLIFEIRSRRPDVILTFDPSDATEGHPDHKLVGIAASEAARFARLPLFHPEQRMEGGLPHLVSEVYYFSKTPQVADKVVDISEELETEIAALKAHSTQVYFLLKQALSEAQALGAPPEVLCQMDLNHATAIMAESLRRRAAQLGAPHGLLAAEVFRREKLFTSSLLQPQTWEPEDIL